MPAVLRAAHALPVSAMFVSPKRRCRSIEEERGPSGKGAFGQGASSQNASLLLFPPACRPRLVRRSAHEVAEDERVASASRTVRATLSNRQDGVQAVDMISTLRA